MKFVTIISNNGSVSYEILAEVMNNTPVDKYCILDPYRNKSSLVVCFKIFEDSILAGHNTDTVSSKIADQMNIKGISVKCVSSGENMLLNSVSRMITESIMKSTMSQHEIAESSGISIDDLVNLQSLDDNEFANPEHLEKVTSFIATMNSGKDGEIVNPQAGITSAYNFYGYKKEYSYKFDEERGSVLCSSSTKKVKISSKEFNQKLDISVGSNININETSVVVEDISGHISIDRSGIKVSYDIQTDLVVEEIHDEESKQNSNEEHVRYLRRFASKYKRLEELKGNVVEELKNTSFQLPINGMEEFSPYNHVYNAFNSLSTKFKDIDTENKSLKEKVSTLGWIATVSIFLLIISIIWF